MLNPQGAGEDFELVRGAVWHLRSLSLDSGSGTCGGRGLGGGLEALRALWQVGGGAGLAVLRRG